MTNSVCNNSDSAQLTTLAHRAGNFCFDWSWSWAENRNGLPAVIRANHNIHGIPTEIHREKKGRTKMSSNELV